MSGLIEYTCVGSNFCHRRSDTGLDHWYRIFGCVVVSGLVESVQHYTYIIHMSSRVILCCMSFADLVLSWRSRIDCLCWNCLSIYLMAPLWNPAGESTAGESIPWVVLKMYVMTTTQQLTWSLHDSSVLGSGRLSIWTYKSTIPWTPIITESWCDHVSCMRAYSNTTIRKISTGR